MEKLTKLKEAFNWARFAGIAKTQREFAKILDISESNLSKALKGDEQYLTNNLIEKVDAMTKYYQDERQVEEGPNQNLLKVIPTGARAGTLADFSESVKDYECEKIVSPIRGADYAIQVTGDSMSPDFPTGCHIIIKRINEEAFVEWGKTYVLDTENGAVLKKILKTDNPEVIQCVSINPAYPPFEVNCKYIRGWYRVLMVLALK